MTDHDPKHGDTLMIDPSLAASLVADYLARLRTATADLPAAPRAELLDNIGAHLAETVPPGADEAATRQALDELGSPEEVAAAARAESGAVERDDSGSIAYDVVTVLALLLGGFVVPVLGWIAGVAMLWSGPRWTVGEKVLGTLTWPVAAVVAVLGFLALNAGIGPIWLIAALVVLPIAFVAVFAYLLRAARSRVAPQRP